MNKTKKKGALVGSGLRLVHVITALPLAAAIVCTVFSVSVVASEKPFEQTHRHVVVQVGGYWASQGRAQDINIEELVGNRYSTAHNRPSNGLFGLGYYVDGPNKDVVQLSYGINGFYLGPTSVNGSISLEHYFTNFDYSYHIQQVPVYLAAKAIIKNSHQKYNVTFDAGIGPNFMKVYDYHETPLDGESVAQQNFSNRNNVVFTAMAGVGLRLNNVFGQIPVECAYRVFYLGQGQMQINNNLYKNALKTGDTYANAILCSVTV